MQSDSEFSISKMKEVIKSEGSKRVGENAANDLGLILDEYGEEIAERAKELADEEGLKTVRANHIKQAVREVER